MSRYHNRFLQSFANVKENATKVDKALCTAHAKAIGRRDGRAASSDGILDGKLTTPRELGGTAGAGTNPEQLFATRDDIDVRLTVV